VGTTINFTNVNPAGLFTLDPGTGGNNSVTVTGTSTSNTVTVHRGSAGTTVQVNALQTVTLVTPDTQELTLDAGFGAVTVSGSAPGMRLTVLGGSPSAPDYLFVHNATPGTTVVVPTGGPEAGTIYTPGGPIIYSGMAVVELWAASGSDTLQFNGTNVSDQIEVLQVGGQDEVNLDTLGILPFFGFGNLDLIGQFGNDQLFVGTLPGVNVTVVGAGGAAGGGGFYNTVNFDPLTQFATLTPTSVNVQGAPVVNLAGISQINFLNSVVDVSALVKLLFTSKVKHLSGHRLMIHFTLGDLSALALGGPLALIFGGLTGGAQVIGAAGSTTLRTPAGVGLPWIGINEGPIPVIHSGQQMGFDVVFHTKHSNVSFTPFFVIASRLP
jgi:hypothetical protein